jgi:uncharacterized protein (DUF433 family)
MQATTYPHIELTPNGVPVIKNANIKVIEIVLDRLAYHWDADEIQRQHPHLQLSEIYSALAYYHDHQDEMDRIIERQLEDLERMKQEIGPSLIRTKLKVTGRRRTR